MYPLRVLVVIFVIFVIIGACQTFVERASGDHAVYLPHIPTPLIRQIQATQEIAWCVNDAASKYPNFVSQLEDVMGEYAARVGIKSRQVAYGTPSTTGCQVQHDMINPHPCGACAAWVYYTSYPVKIEYKMALGYVDWRSAHGHELGHALLGLNERYRDSGGSIGCGGPEVGITVMDCGPPHVRYPQPLDVERGCAVLATSWCGMAPVDPVLGTPPDYSPECWTDAWDPYWNGRWNQCDGGAWVGPDGRFCRFDANGCRWFYANGVPIQ